MTLVTESRGNFVECYEKAARPAKLSDRHYDLDSPTVCEDIASEVFLRLPDAALPLPSDHPAPPTTTAAEHETYR
jgi:hypothetical protein